MRIMLEIKNPALINALAAKFFTETGQQLAKEIVAELVEKHAITIKVQTDDMPSPVEGILDPTT